MRGPALALAIIASSAPARAQDGAPLSPPLAENALSLSVPALSVRALAVSYERANVPDARFSIMGLLGARLGATEDYSSNTLSLAAEMRYWLTGRLPWLQAPRANVGAFVGLRLGLARTVTYDDIDDERIGHTITLTETLQLGFRFVAWRRLEITPSLGAQLRHELELAHRLPTWTRGGIALGLTAGWMF